MSKNYIGKPFSESHVGKLHEKIVQNSLKYIEKTYGSAIQKSHVKKPCEQSLIKMRYVKQKSDSWKGIWQNHVAKLYIRSTQIEPCSKAIQESPIGKSYNNGSYKEGRIRKFLLKKHLWQCRIGEPYSEVVLKITKWESHRTKSHIGKQYGKASRRALQKSHVAMPYRRAVLRSHMKNN